MAEAAQQQSAEERRRAVRPVHGAADWRRRLRRELLRVGVASASIYIDGSRGVARMRFPAHADRLSVPVSDALSVLRSLPDRAGIDTTLDALRGT